MDFTLTLVRHGESEANVRHMLSGWMDVDLTEHGRKELEELRQSVDYPVSEAYYASPLRRCRDTSHILFPYADPIISDDFKEIDFRSLEGWIMSSKAEIDAYFESWIEDEPYIDEETMSEVMERGRNALLRVVETEEGNGRHSATVVMHSGIMRSAIVSLFSLDRTEFLRMSVPNGLGYVLEFDGIVPVAFKPIQ